MDPVLALLQLYLSRRAGLEVEEPDDGRKPPARGRIPGLIDETN